ncbi:hypothetical protein V8D89_009092 [Ganoderma adspersum]
MQATFRFSSLALRTVSSALEVPPSPRLPTGWRCGLRISMLGIRDSSSVDWPTSGSSPVAQLAQLVAGCPPPSPAFVQTPSHQDAHCGLAAGPHSLLHLAPAPLSPLCVSYHTAVSCLRITCLHVHLAYRIPYHPAVSIRHVPSLIPPWHLHRTFELELRYCSHPIIPYIITRALPYPILSRTSSPPSFPRPSTSPAHPHIHTNTCILHADTSERPLTFARLVFSLCVPDFICSIHFLLFLHSVPHSASDSGSTNGI